MHTPCPCALPSSQPPQYEPPSSKSNLPPFRCVLLLAVMAVPVAAVDAGDELLALWKPPGAAGNPCCIPHGYNRPLLPANAPLNVTRHRRPHSKHTHTQPPNRKLKTSRKKMPRHYKIALIASINSVNGRGCERITNVSHIARPKTSNQHKRLAKILSKIVENVENYVGERNAPIKIRSLPPQR